jgi:hypothetical protein
MMPKALAVATAARFGAPNAGRIGTPTVPPPMPCRDAPAGTLPWRP